MSDIFYRILSATIIALTLQACNSSREIVYLQDMPDETYIDINNESMVKVKPGDRIAINVRCSEPELAAPFNIRNSSRQINRRLEYQPVEDYLDYNDNSISAYAVDGQGYIDFPVFGEINVSGLTRKQISDFIKWKIVKGEYIRDPIVSVEFLNLHFSVLGEVNKPGQYTITDDCITLLEALGMAGDLSIVGKRDKIYVIREDEGRRVRHSVDLRDHSLFDSPAYYIQQNDVIYVEPNKVRSGQSTVNENNWKSTGFWMSLTSFLLSVGILILK